MRHTYTIKTDACEREIEAHSADEAASIFATQEQIGFRIATVDDLFNAVKAIGDGAWCWIECFDLSVPDGARRSVQAD